MATKNKEGSRIATWKINLIHRTFEKKPNHVATWTSNDAYRIDEVLEKLWTATQNLRDSWSKKVNGVTFGANEDGSDQITWIAPLFKNKKGEVFGHRSTSMGDLAIAEYKNDVLRFYVVVTVGWKRISTEKFMEIMSIDGFENARQYCSDINCNEDKLLKDKEAA